MGVETVHVILTDYGKQFGWGIASPQLPELAGGAATLQDLEAEVPELVLFGGANPDSPIEVHYQRYVIAPNGQEFVVRIAQRERPLRAVLAARLSAAYEIPDQRRNLLTEATNATGEITFICCLPTDTVQWVGDQVNEGDAAVIVVSVDGMQIATVPIATAEERMRSGPRRTLADSGLSLQSTVAELLAVTPMRGAPGDTSRVDNEVSARTPVLISA